MLSRDWRGPRTNEAQTLNADPRKRVGETIARISNGHKKPTRGRVVAGLSFGFWRALFDRKYHQLWNTHLHRAFPQGSGNRSEVAGLMSRLVPFRNRVAHHETIIRRPITTHYNDMLALARLIDADARTWIKSATGPAPAAGQAPGRWRPGVNPANRTDESLPLILGEAPGRPNWVLRSC